MHKRIAPLLMALVIVPFGYTSSEPISSCHVFEYPQVNYTKYGTLESDLGRLEAERQNALAATDDEWRAAYERHAENIEYSIPLGKLKRAAIQRNQSDFAEALEELHASGYRDGLGLNLLEIYFYSHEMGLSEIDPEWLEAGISEIRPSIAKLDRNGFRERLEVMFALFELMKGNRTAAEELVSAIKPETTAVSEMFARGYLTYHLARQTSDLEGLEQAIEELGRLATDESLVECNQALLGMTHFYLADSAQLISEIMLRKPEGENSGFRHLHQARMSIAKARSNLDILFVPGLWSLAYEKSAEIFGLLAEHERSPSAAREYAAMAENAWKLSRWP